MRDNSISIFRLTCIFLMTFHHDELAPALHNFGSHLPYTEAHSTLSYLGLVLVDGFSLISSPFLGFLSGYFVSGNLRERSYVSVVRSRFVSLYIPVVVWSVAFFAVMLFVGYLTADTAFVSRTLTKVDVGYFLGIGHWPANYPLHYLVALFQCILISPVLVFTLERFGRSTFLVLVLLAFSFLFGADPNHHNPGENVQSFLPRADLFLFFSLGIFSQRRWNAAIGVALERLRIKRPAVLVVVIILFLLATVHWRWLLGRDGDLAIALGYPVMMFVRVTGGLLVLAMLPWFRALADRGLRIDDGLTFTLFCSHVISFFLLNMALGWGRSDLIGIAGFFLAPFFATGVAATIFWVQKDVVANLRRTSLQD